MTVHRSGSRARRTKSQARKADGSPPAVSAFHSIHERAAIAAGTPHPEDRTLRQGAVLVSRALWDWFWHLARYAFDKAPPFLPYDAPDTGIITVDDRTTIGLAGDWGSGTDSAYAVAKAMRALSPDITIHLGDVYYTGSRAEFRDYFLPEDCWPRGKKGTYALNGNHEMYSAGHAYFAAIKELGQQRSYFCLENAHWRLVALDTGYLCSGNIRVILAKVPFVRKLFHDSTSLPQPLIDWLRDVVFADATDARPVVFLSHHQPYSAFVGEVEYKRVRACIEPYLPRTCLWIWGHEHRMALYSGREGVRGRCIGHGGIPVELPFKVAADNRGLVVYDERVSPAIVDNIRTGYNGFAVMSLVGAAMTLRYYDELSREGDAEDFLLEERWVVVDGAAKGTVKLGARGAALTAVEGLDALVE